MITKEVLSGTQLIEYMRSNTTYECIIGMNDIELAKFTTDIKAMSPQGMKSEIGIIIKEWDKKRKLAQVKETLPLNDIKLELDEKMNPVHTIDNFTKVLEGDSKFNELSFNLLKYSPEIIRQGKRETWIDADDSWMRHYMESAYKLYCVPKSEDAFRIHVKKKSYHPIRVILDSVVWDRKDRIKTLLIDWLGCENNEYSMEVSRLIFAGGINRLYNPGCKFDDVAIFVGSNTATGINQGGGKSTFVRWLAIQDDFFKEVNEIEGQKGMEALEGAWVCELAELLAMTKTKDVESIKSYITRQNDTYRRPFDRRVSEHKRQCIFVGTTNLEQFLTDKTGNRRYYPIKVNKSGYDLFDNEVEIRAEILQCWAEAKYKLKTPEMQPYANRNMLDNIRSQQMSAVEDDYREESINEYIESRNIVCILELWKFALGNEYSNPSPKDSKEIGLILTNIGGWERGKNVAMIDRIEKRQRVWERMTPIGDGIPFLD